MLFKAVPDRASLDSELSRKTVTHLTQSCPGQHPAKGYLELSVQHPAIFYSELSRTAVSHAECWVLSGTALSQAERCLGQLWVKYSWALAGQLWVKYSWVLSGTALSQAGRCYLTTLLKFSIKQFFKITNLASKVVLYICQFLAFWKIIISKLVMCLVHWVAFMWFWQYKFLNFDFNLKE